MTRFHPRIALAAGALWHAIGCADPASAVPSSGPPSLASSTPAASAPPAVSTAPVRVASAGPSAPPAPPSVDPASLPDEPADPRTGWPKGYTPSRVRDRVELDFAGRRETWLLRWKDDPEPACFVAEARTSGKCLGIDGAGESGRLEIVRMRGDEVIARDDLTELLAGRGPLVIPRFPVDVRYSARGLASAAAKPLLVLGDYNQDGVAGELVLPGPMRVWGPRPGVLIGFSPSTGKLFGYQTIDTATWENVKTMTTTLEVVTHRCFDHGSPTEYVDVFTKTKAGVTRGRKELTCIDKGSRVERGAVVSSEPDAPLGF